MPVVARLDIGGVRTAIHKYRAVCVRPANIKNKQAVQFRNLNKLNTIRRKKLPGQPRSLATCMWFQLMALTVVIQGLCPWFKRNYIYRCDRVKNAEHGCPHTFLLQACTTENYPALGISWRRPKFFLAIPAR